MRDIKEYEGLYAITSCGKVWSYRSNSFLSFDNSNGYARVALYRNGKAKKFFIHQLVAKAYIPNPNNLIEIHHIDANTLNNCVNNLAWITHKENLAQKERLDRINKKVICIETKEIFNSIKEAATAKNLQASHIGEVCKGKRKTHGGYHWSFAGGEAFVND